MRASLTSLLLLFAIALFGSAGAGVGAGASDLAARAVSLRALAPACLSLADEGRVDVRGREASAIGGTSATGGGGKPAVVHTRDRARTWRLRGCSLLASVRDTDAAGGVLAMRFLRVNGTANADGSRT